MDEELRIRLVEILIHSQAHMGLEEAVADFPMAEINTRFPNGEYSAWGLLEHIRYTQNDIVDFILSPSYKEKEWPKQYWPDPDILATPTKWQKTIDLYHRDLKKLITLINDPHVDLNAIVKNGTNQTYLREILVVADHTSYHLGEFGIMRQVMATWGKR